jgi:hypothetical protein
MSVTVDNARNDLLAWAAFYAVLRKHHEELRYRSNLVSRNTVDETARVQQGAQAIENQHKVMPQSALLLLQAALTEFGPFVGSSATDTAVLLAALYVYMLQNSIEIKSRGTVYGAAADGGGNTGNQTLLLCTKNSADQVVESATIEALTFRCVQQASSREQLGQEAYEVLGQGRGLYSELRGNGRGIAGDTIIGFEPGVTGLLDNPSFDDSFSGSGVDKIPGWLFSSGQTNVARTTASFARDRGSGNHASLVATGNFVLRFYFRTRGKALTDLLPYVGALRWRADGANGNIAFGFGSAGTLVHSSGNIATSNQATFQEARLNVDRDEAWRANFDTDANPYFEIQVNGYVSGNIWIDDALASEMLQVGGRFVAIASGIDAPLAGDDADEHTQECTLDVGTGNVTLDSGAAGSLDSLTIGSVEMLSAVIPFNGTLAQTAQDAVDNANAKQPTFPEYVFSRVGAAIHFAQVVPVEGTIAVVSASTTIATTDTNVTGASLGKTQDAIVRRTGGYLPHAASPTSGWEDDA